MVPFGSGGLCSDFGDYELQFVASVVVDRCCVHAWEHCSGEGDVVDSGSARCAEEGGAMWAMAEGNQLVVCL